MKFSHSVFSAKKNDASLKFYLKKSPDDENRRRKEKLREKKKSLWFMYQHCNDMTET